MYDRRGKARIVVLQRLVW